jgi:hypothetical protein
MRKATKRTFSKSKTPDELRNWSLTKAQIGHQLKKHYQAYTTEELPPRLLALIKKLNHEEPEQPEGAAKSIAWPPAASRRRGPSKSLEACFVVRDVTGQALSYVYYENEPGRRPAAELLGKDEARRIAANHCEAAWTFTQIKCCK